MPQQNIYDILKERGFIEQSTNKNGLRQLLSKQKAAVYIGFDATASSLHVGHLIQMMTLTHIQKAGHQPIVLIGGGTTLIGDPSGKDKARPIMNREEINKNIQSLKNQFSRVIDFENNRNALVLNNADWLSKLNYIEFLRDFGSHFSVNRMLTHEAIKTRLAKGMSFLEFNYQLLQAYDFWHLFKNYGCRIQIGGSDQWGNIVAGVELIRKIEGKEVFGATAPLITTSNGKKMGKTEKGAIWLDSKMTSPYEYYQFWINTDDNDVINFLLLFTFLTTEEIKNYADLKGANLREAKKILAFEATKIIHGRNAAEKAAEASKSLFGKEKKSIDLIPATGISRKEIKKGIPMSKLFVIAGLTKSISESVRLIKQGGAYLNEKRLENPNLLLDENDFNKGEILLRLGKKKHQRIKID